MKYLLHSIREATYQSGDLFRLTPYKNPHDGNLFYGIIDTRHVGDGTPHEKPLRTCLVEMADDLREEVRSLDYPGGATVDFFQQKSRDWLVSVKAQNIIASKYLRLTDADMQKLLANLDK